MLVFDSVNEFTFEGVTYKVPTAMFEGYKVFQIENLPVMAMASYTRIDLTTPGICIHPEFLYAPETFQKFVLYHEIGHIVNGHVELTEDDMKRTAKETNEKFQKYLENRYSGEAIDEKEFIADEYAMRKIGKDNAIKCLHTLEMITRHVFEFSKGEMDEEKILEGAQLVERICTEIHARIKHLESLE